MEHPPAAMEKLRQQAAMGRLHPAGTVNRTKAYQKLKGRV
jgi:hypothetical protein